MAKPEITMIVNMEQLDEANEKVNQLKATLEECRQLIDSLSNNQTKLEIKPIVCNGSFDIHEIISDIRHKGQSGY